MKMKRPPKNASDLKRGQRLVTPAERAKLAPEEQQSIRFFEEKMKAHQDRRAAEIKASEESPLAAFKAGQPYTGPLMPDKGKRDGSCNRTACQLPLAGHRQFYMRGDFDPNGRNHYCAKCERQFAEVDRRNGEAPRCKPDEDNDNRPRRESYW